MGGKKKRGAGAGSVPVGGPEVAAAASSPEPEASSRGFQPPTMSVCDLKEELKAGGINTAGMLEKDDLVAAVMKLRLAPPSDGEAGAAMGKVKQRGTAKPSTVPPERTFPEQQLLLSSGTATCDQCGIRTKHLKSCRGCFLVAYCCKE
jgi:hypothetical protein